MSHRGWGHINRKMVINIPNYKAGWTQSGWQRSTRWANFSTGNHLARLRFVEHRCVGDIRPAQPWFFWLHAVRLETNPIGHQSDLQTIDKVNDLGPIFEYCQQLENSQPERASFSIQHRASNRTMTEGTDRALNCNSFLSRRIFKILFQSRVLEFVGFMPVVFNKVRRWAAYIPHVEEPRPLRDSTVADVFNGLSD